MAEFLLNTDTADIPIDCEGNDGSIFKGSWVTQLLFPPPAVADRRKSCHSRGSTSPDEDYAAALVNRARRLGGHATGDRHDERQGRVDLCSGRALQG